MLAYESISLPPTVFAPDVNQRIDSRSVKFPQPETGDNFLIYQRYLHCHECGALARFSSLVTCSRRKTGLFLLRVQSFAAKVVTRDKRR